MNDKSHAAAPADATPRESNAKPDDGVAGTVTVYGNWGVLTCNGITGNVLSYDRSDSDSVCDTDGYANIDRIDIEAFRKTFGFTNDAIDILYIAYWTKDGRYEPTASVITPSETVGERLKRVYPEHYTRIITEMNRQNGAEHAARQLSSPSAGWTVSGCVLQGAFLWGNSQEGYRFWAKLEERERS